RQQELYATGVVDQQLFDDTKTQQELAQARLHMARARFKRADEDKKDSVLYAPFSGFVVERRMNSGELFSGMANEYVFHLIDTRTVEVESNIIETKKRYLKQQQAVTVTVDAIPDKSFAGTITAINPLVDPASRKFLVKITVKNPSFELESGMFARVGIPEKSSLQAILVPAGAVIERHGKTVLFTTENNRAVTKEVKIGLVTHELLEVIDSISEGTPVITDGLYAVKDGTPIKVISRQ
ncbi:MAG: efflux RND transporter periplasmic adaptor subunit, partial [Deltaproteobacteria bacterium]|nr:efflux RND transporter periplasmic adaptor subunit [Deltaproteobacteria bacterium]